MTISYWQDINKALRRREQVKADNKYDIAVIGGGLLGIAVSYYLKSLGCERVVALEKEYVGYGASGRNAGFLLSGLAEPYSRLVVGMGHDWAKLLMRATLDNHELTRKAINDNKIKCDYQRNGSYHLAVSDVERRELTESVELLLEDGFEAKIIDPLEISEKLKPGKYRGGYCCPADGSLDPYAFVNGLARDIEIVEGYEVKQVRKSGGHVEIVDENQTIKAEMAVLATNAYSPLLDSFFEKMIFPVRGQMLAARKDYGNLLGGAGFYSNFGYDYFRETLKGTILMGGLRDRFIETEVGTEDVTNPELQKGLEEYIRANMGIERFKVLNRWSGLMANTIDGLPLVGTLPHNSSVIAAIGCNGHGFGLGMIIARDVASAIMENKTSDLLKRFSIKRFA